MSGLLLLTATAVACLVMRKKSMDKIGYTYRRNRYYGGNSGYVGYSMSRRAADAREQGKYPKGDFRKNYNITLNSFNLLIDIGVIDDSEWHHTSKYGNQTTFYAWALDEYKDIYFDNKKEIDKLTREYYNNLSEIRKSPYSFFRDLDININTASNYIEYTHQIKGDWEKDTDYRATEKDVIELQKLYDKGFDLVNMNNEIKDKLDNIFYS